MNVAADLELLRKLHGTGHRTRSRAEARYELVAACRALGELASEWTATAYVPPTDLAKVDAAIEGVRRLLQELRAEDRAQA